MRRIESVSGGIPNYSFVVLLLAVPRRLFRFRSVVVVDMICGYVLLLLLDII